MSGPPRLSLGEGVYQLGVALADEKGLPEDDWHDRAYRIQVVSDQVSEGPVHQPRVWSIPEQSPGGSQPARCERNIAPDPSVRTPQSAHRNDLAEVPP